MTSPEVRAELEKVGWELNLANDVVEVWHYPDACIVWTLKGLTVETAGTANLGSILRFAAIAGITPQGYRIVKEG